MLTTQDETSIIERIKSARSEAEPVEPTEEPDIVDMSEPEEPIEEVAEVEETQEAEEIEEEAEEVADDFYLDLDGEEVSFSQIREWKQGHMMQSDYTRKTTEVAEQRKAFEQELEAFNANQAKVNALAAELQAEIESSKLSDEKIKELREYEPDEYIKYIESQQRKQSLLEQAKQDVKPTYNPQEEQQKLLAANPQWVENGQATQAYQDDVKMLNDYANQVGMTPEKFNSLDASMMQIMLDAARSKQTNKKSAAIAKKVRKAPVMTKPGGQSKSNAQSEVEKLQAKFNKTGSVEDAVALRKAKRKLNNQR